MNANDVVGWMASVVLLITIGTQVARQWRTGRVEGVSPWLFVGQLVASIGFVVYSALLQSTVFIVTNSALALAAIVGMVAYLRASDDPPSKAEKSGAEEGIVPERARSGDENEDDRATLPVALAPAVLTSVLSEPTHDAVGDEGLADPLTADAGDMRVDLVVSSRDTIGADPLHRVVS